MDGPVVGRRRAGSAIGAVLLLAGAALVLHGLAPRAGLDGAGAVARSATPPASTRSADTPTARTPTPTGILSEPVGDPRSVTVVRGRTVLLRAELDRQPAADGVLTSAPGRAGWYSAPGWPRPGQLSTNRSIIVGHVRWEGRADTFAALPEVRVGDVVVVAYAEEELRFVVDRAPVAVDKTIVTGQADSTYRWVWRSTQPERTISLFTCDLDSGERADGHLKGNWVLQARRVA